MRQKKITEESRRGEHNAWINEIRGKRNTGIYPYIRTHTHTLERGRQAETRRERKREREIIGNCL